MKKIFQQSAFILIRELLWRCFGNKVIWRRFFVLVAVLTVSAFAFQTLVHTCLVLPDRPFGSHHRTDYSLLQSSSSSLQSEESLKEGTLQKVHLTLTNSVISPDASNKLLQSFSVEQENAELESRVQRKSSGTASKKDTNIADTTKGVVSLSPQRHVPKQKHIWLLPPNEALVLAKREIDHAPAVNEDPDLYAPIFRNISVFKSARQMGLALYVPGSHNLKPLSNFLRDYVNKIAAKYPFWNRTHGSDHFLVACHDWGPYTVTGHEELAKNTIKALCNADLSERIFVAGRDVSLPETTIRVPRKPLRYLGGNRASLRPILAFFAGSMHGRVRPTLLKYWGGGKDEDMKIYKRLPLRVSQRMTYIQHMKSNNFVLPFNEVLDWSAFSVVVAEKDIPRLKEILLSIPVRKYLTMQNNVKMLQKHFLWNPRPIRYDLFHMILHSIWLNKLNQIQTLQI